MYTFRVRGRESNVALGVISFCLPCPFVVGFLFCGKQGWNVAMFLQPLGLHDLVGKKDKER